MYAPDLRTPIRGHCAAYMPPRPIILPFDGCPYDNDDVSIDNAAVSRGFDEHILRSVVFVVSDRADISRPYRTLADLRRDNPDATRAYAVFYDFNRIPFRRSEIITDAVPQPMPP